MEMKYIPNGDYWRNKQRLIHLIRKSPQCREWSRAVKRRDNRTCQECGCKEKLEAHHERETISQILARKNIMLYEDAMNCKDLWDLNNGKTLCLYCHQKTDNYGHNYKKKYK